MADSSKPIQGGNLYQFPNLGPSRGDLNGGDGGGTYGGMEARVASLEAHMLNVRENIGLIRTDVRTSAADISTLKTDLATLKSDVSHLPTTGKMVVAASVVLGIIATLIGLAPKIQAFFGTVPH